MPQIAQLAETWSSQVFWMLIFFGFIFFVIGRGMVPRIEKVVDDRNQRIQGDLAIASAARTSADEAEERMRAADLEARGQAQAVLAKAKTEAAKKTEAALAKADAELSEKLAVADASLAKACAEAAASLEGAAIEAVRDIVARVSGAQVTESDAASAVKAVLVHG